MGVDVLSFGAPKFETEKWLQSLEAAKQKRLIAMNLAVAQLAVSLSGAEGSGALIEDRIEGEITLAEIPALLTPQEEALWPAAAFIAKNLAVAFETRGANG